MKREEGQKKSARRGKMREKHEKVKTKEKQRCIKGKRERWGRRREQKEQREVREEERRRINKGSVLE